MIMPEDNHRGLLKLKNSGSLDSGMDIGRMHDNVHINMGGEDCNGGTWNKKGMRSGNC